MRKISLLLCLFSLFGAILAPWQDASAQEAQTLQGKVLRDAGQSAPNAVKDAIVSFVEASAQDPALATYATIATTVSDSQGMFQVILGQLSPTTLYAIRARGSNDVWSTKLLGTGANESDWINSATIIVGNSPSELDLLDKRIAEETEKDIQIRQKDLDILQHENEIRLKLNDLDAQKATSAIQSQADQLRQQLSAIANQRDESAMAQGNQAMIEQRLHNTYQQAANHEPGGHFGTKRVIFATDRAIDSSHGSPQILNDHNANGDLAFGLCDVAVERQGSISSNFLHLIEDRDADRFYSVQKVVTVDKDALWREVGSELGTASSHDGLLFIHGFNVSFEDGCRRAAQIAYDIKFPGPIFLYSWPSHASVRAYDADGDMAEWSEPHFSKFLKELLTKHGIDHLHIIAHSMGNRILVKTLFADKPSATEQSHLGQIILAAPDVDRLIFDQQIVVASIKPLRVTLYASGHDQALLASKLIHWGSRLGDARPTIDLQEGMDSVDASAVDTSFLGHSYIGSSRSVLMDVAALISSNTAPLNRAGVITQGLPPKQWWLLNP